MNYPYSICAEIFIKNIYKQLSTGQKIKAEEKVMRFNV
jgi:hypothetical protein